MKLRDTEAAYAAGILDGEGSIDLSRNHRSGWPSPWLRPTANYLNGFAPPAEWPSALYTAQRAPQRRDGRQEARVDRAFFLLTLVRQ